FDQPLVLTGRVHEAEFREDIAAIFGVIKEYVPESKVGLKYHPGMHSDEKYIDYGRVLPKHLPGEAFYSSGVKLYVSFSSGAITRAKSGTILSLLDLIRFKDEEAKEYIRERLISRSQSPILFPKDLGELREILASVVSNK
ncbi:MAG: hypothetical protein ACRD1R_19345, partial [Acidobacteriota bacterium]